LDGGEDLTGPDGLGRQRTKTVLEAALDEEMSEHPGYDKHGRRLTGAGPARYKELAEKRDKPYPAIKTLWDNA